MVAEDAPASEDADWKALRAFVARCRSRYYDVGLSAAVSERAENDFVESRQSGKKLTQNDLARWITIARLIAATQGAPEATVEHWEAMRDLERERESRNVQ